MIIAPGTEIERYHIVESLGRGGMAEVYKAFDTRLERDVAVKVIRRNAFSPDTLERVLKRFDREAKSLAKLTHPNIVSLLDYGMHDDFPFLVMEYLPGGNLKQQLGKLMPWQQAAAILAPIADALAFAHGQGVLHRDVKPSNILITQSGQPMLSDFGIAKVLEDDATQDLTTSGMGIGTPEYMAPEQFTTHAYDKRSDIYALGIVFYELVAGRTPFVADTPYAVAIKQATEPLPRLKGFAPGLPDKVDKVVIKALAKKPADRYADMRQFSAALRQLGAEGVQRMASEKPAAQPKASPAPQTTPAKTGNRGLLIGAGVVGTVLVLFAAYQLLGGKGNPPTSTPRPNDTKAPFAAAETTRVTPTHTVIPHPAITPAPTLGVGSSMVSPADGMLMMYVPAGEFIMGTAKDEPFNNEPDEFPQHTVYLDAYWIDSTEITNSMFSAFIDDVGSDLEQDFWGKGGWTLEEGYENHPAVNVSWESALAYCEWAGKRLPTEAEWEKAARGTDGRTTVWEDQSASACTHFNYGNSCTNFNCDWCDDFPTTAPVGFFPDGVSFFGALDMASNVMEWVADWYQTNYYSSSPERNPQGPETGTNRVLRGGYWNSRQGGLRPASRNFLTPSNYNDYIGFRCAMDAD